MRNDPPGIPHSRERENTARLLACRDGLRLPRSETLPTIVGNRAVDDGAAVNALPGVEDEEEIGEPF